MKKSTNLFTGLFMFLAALSFNSWGDTDLSNKPVKVSFETFEEDLNNHASTLDSFELGEQRLVTVKGYFINNGVNCPYTFTSQEKIIGTDSNGIPKVFRETNFGQENQDPNCADYKPPFEIDIFNVKAFIEQEKEFISNSIIEKIGEKKYLFKNSNSEDGLYVEVTFDLNKPLFLNPIEAEMFQNESPGTYKERGKYFITKLP